MKQICVLALCILSSRIVLGCTSKYLWMTDDQGNIRLENLQIKNFSPPKAEVTDITFYLYTVNNLDDPEEIQADNFETLVSSQLYDPQRKNAFLLHGWTASWTSSYIKNIKQAILSKHDMNVFAIDWSGPAGLGYINSVNEVKPTGEIIANFAKQMIVQYSITAEDFVLIGHSLGGQLVGKIGANLNGEVDTIVALDPAGPLFSLENTELSLDPSDGKFVHVIHTNSAYMGFPDSCGDVDYYPNGGYKQPGCGTDTSGSCSHARSHQFYVESILTGGFKAVKCSLQEDFDNGLCNGNEVSFLGRVPVDKMEFHKVSNDI